MSVFVALLRGINVTGHRRVPMKELREALTAYGLHRVSTYIQSGNIVFEAKKRDYSPIISGLIEDHFGHADVPVMIRTGTEFARVAAAHPFAQRTSDEKHLHVTFLGARPGATARKAFNAVPRGDEEYVLEGREVFLYCPSGYGRTKLTNDVCERKLEVQATTRNLRTVRALAKLAHDLG